MRRRTIVTLATVVLAVLAVGVAWARHDDGSGARVRTGALALTTTTRRPTTTSTSTTTTTAPTTTTSVPATSEVAPVTDPAPVDPTVPAPAPTYPPPPVGNGTRVLMVGDSVMLGAEPALEGLPGWDVGVDARVGRQVGAPYANNGIDAIAADHQPGVDTRVVIHLGTNGLFSDAQLDQIMSILADVPRVVLLTVRIPTYPDVEAANNDMIRAAPSRYPQIVVVDWKAASDANPQWLGSDNIHLTPEGEQAYASMVGSAL